MEEPVRLRIADMIEYAGKAVRMLDGRTAQALRDDEMRFLAIVHAVQIVGEAARKAPDEIRAKVPSVAWRSAIAMRNILVHDYGDVDVDVLVDTVRNDFPPLIADLERLLGEDDT